MPKADQVKIQFVLTPAARAQQDRRDLESRLRALGITVTAAGLATLSAEVSRGDFKKLWKTNPATRSGFAEQLEEPGLDIPQSLADDIASISLVPRHMPFNR
jgi:hypothetical protein